MVRLRLREYQEQAIEGANALIAAGKTRPAIVQATGLGKTVTFSNWIANRLTEQPRQRALVLVHRDELATQARDKIHQIAPHLRPGIVMGAQRDHDRPVVVASIQTLSAGRMRNDVKEYARRDSVRNVGTIVADECHHAAAQTWRDTLRHFGAWDGVPTLGVTATMTREDGKGLGEIWDDVVQRPEGGVWDTRWGVQNGYLCDVRGVRVQVPQLDLSGVHIRAGDLQQEETAERMLNADTGGAIIRAIHDILTPEYGQRRGVVFCPNVATAQQWCEEMNAAGIPSGVIIGSTPKAERARKYEAFRTGKLWWLLNAMVLTEGWDAPWCDALVIARPTKSAGLYQQMVGRGLRLFPGKTECIVLDVCGATDVHGLASLVDLAEDSPVKPKDRQSLLEAEDEWVEDEPIDAAGWMDALHAPVHKVIGTEIDMFGQSRSLWLQTHRGNWFVPAGDQFFFLWPNGDGMFNLGATSKVRLERAVLLHEDPIDLEMGMALVEQYAAEYDPTTATKDAAWRQDGRARPGQLAELRDLGITKGLSVMSKAQAYDRWNVEVASRRIDR